MVNERAVPTHIKKGHPKRDDLLLTDFIVVLRPLARASSFYVAVYRRAPATGLYIQLLCGIFVVSAHPFDT